LCDHGAREIMGQASIAANRGVGMSEHEHAAEDLEVESAEAASVAGGFIQRTGADAPISGPGSEIAGLQAKGYIEESCTTEGMLMVNRKTNHKVIVKL
jgi:hypothetical protein